MGWNGKMGRLPILHCGGMGLDPAKAAGFLTRRMVGEDVVVWYMEGGVEW